MSENTEVEMDEEYRLSPADAKQPADDYGQTVTYALPLPEQDRKAISEQFRRRKRNRYTLLEIAIAITCICITLAPATWLPLDIFALILGIAAAISLIGLVRSGAASRLLATIVVVLLAIYFVTATVVLLRFSGMMD